MTTPERDMSLCYSGKRTCVTIGLVRNSVVKYLLDTGLQLRHCGYDADGLTRQY